MVARLISHPVGRAETSFDALGIEQAVQHPAGHRCPLILRSIGGNLPDMLRKSFNDVIVPCARLEVLGDRDNVDGVQSQFGHGVDACVGPGDETLSIVELMQWPGERQRFNSLAEAPIGRSA